MANAADVGFEVGKMVSAHAVVDEKGRIMVPKPLRTELGITEGSKVSVRLEEEEGLAISKMVDPEDFTRDMEGFITNKSSVPLVGPLSLKLIWEKA